MPPLADERTCSSCGASTNGILFVQMQWCPGCLNYDYGLKNEEPIRLNTIVADLHRSQSWNHNLPQLGLNFEQYEDSRVTFLAWRCFILTDGRIKQSSSLPHPNPGEALRELVEMLAPA